MRESNQKKRLVIIIVILLIANAVTLWMLFKPRGREMKENSKKSGMSSYLKTELGYDEGQLKAFDSLHNTHKADIQEISKEMHSEKERRFKYLAEHSFSDSTIGTAVATMSEKQKVLEMKMLHHLRKVRELGTTEQRAKFDTSFVPYMNRMRQKSKKNKN